MRYYGPITSSASTTQTSGVSSFFTLSDNFAQCKLPVIGNITGNPGQAYFCYVGYWPANSVWQHACVWVTTGGGDNIPAEIGIFSSPLAPAGSPQVLTRLAATQTLDGLNIGTAAHRNLVQFGLTLATATHLWGGIRTNVNGAEPTCPGHHYDGQECQLLTFNSAPALTSTTSWLATNVANSANAQAHWIRLEQF